MAWTESLITAYNFIHLNILRARPNTITLYYQFRI